MGQVKIGNRIIGDGYPCFIVAEAGCNHNQSVEIAKKLVDSAVQSHSDAVKFQTYIAEKMYSRKTPMIQHFKERLGLDDNATMFDLIKMTEMPYEMHKPIVEHCRQNGIVFLSTPFDIESFMFLEEFNVPAYKIASFEMTHYPLLEAVASAGKPIILSTGMSSLGDIEKALSVIHKQSNTNVILLHCVSNYPAKPQDYNLRVINTLKLAFGVPVGISDHTPGVEVAKVAVAAGANFVEKHITIDQSLPGPDHFFSLTPEQLNSLVSGIRDVEQMLGSPYKKCIESEKPMKHIGRRSLVAGKAAKAGQELRVEMIEVKRPGFGIHPEMIDIIAGKKLKRDIEADEPLAWDMFIQE